MDMNIREERATLKYVMNFIDGFECNPEVPCFKEFECDECILDTISNTAMSDEHEKVLREYACESDYAFGAMKGRVRSRLAELNKEEIMVLKELVTFIKDYDCNGNTCTREEECDDCIINTINGMSMAKEHKELFIEYAKEGNCILDRIELKAKERLIELGVKEEETNGNGDACECCKRKGADCDDCDGCECGSCIAEEEEENEECNDEECNNAMVINPRGIVVKRDEEASVASDIKSECDELDRDWLKRLEQSNMDLRAENNKLKKYEAENKKLSQDLKSLQGIHKNAVSQIKGLRTELEERNKYAAPVNVNSDVTDAIKMLESLRNEHKNYIHYLEGEVGRLAEFNRQLKDESNSLKVKHRLLEEANNCDLMIIEKLKRTIQELSK